VRRLFGDYFSMNYFSKERCGKEAKKYGADIVFFWQIL